MPPESSPPPPRQLPTAAPETLPPTSARASPATVAPTAAIHEARNPPPVPAPASHPASQKPLQSSAILLGTPDTPPDVPSSPPALVSHRRDTQSTLLPSNVSSCS